MIHLIEAHPVASTLVFAWTYLVFVAGMPKPSPTSSVAFRWLYTSLNVAAVNLETLLKTRLPGAPLPDVEPGPRS